MKIRVITLCCLLATIILAVNKTPRNKNLNDSDITSSITNSTVIDPDTSGSDTTLCIVVCRDTANVNCPYLKINRAYFYDQPIAIAPDGQVINTWGQACTDSIANDWIYWVPQLVTLRQKRANKIVNDTLNYWYVDSATVNQTKHGKIRDKRKRWQGNLGSIKIKKVAK